MTAPAGIERGVRALIGLFFRKKSAKACECGGEPGQLVFSDIKNYVCINIEIAMRYMVAESLYAAPRHLRSIISEETWK